MSDSLRQINCHEEDHAAFKIIAAQRKKKMIDLFHDVVEMLKTPELKSETP